MIRGDGYGAVGFSNVADCCLGSRREVEDSEADRGERTPSAGEGVGVNGAVDGGGCGCRGTGKGKIVYSSVLAGFAGFGDPRERGGLKWANEGLNLRASARTDVAALGELVGDHVLVSFRMLEQSGAIRGGEGSINRLYASVEAFEQRRDQIWVFDK